MSSSSLAVKQNHMQDKMLVRLSMNSFKVSPDVAEYLGFEAGQPNRAIVEFDKDALAIQVTKSPTSFDGLSFAMRPGAKSAHTAVPAQLKKAKFPRGIYRLHPQKPGVFVYDPDYEIPDFTLQRHKKKEEASEILTRTRPVIEKLQIGDAVKWLAHKADTPYWAQGSIIGFEERRRKHHSTGVKAIIAPIAHFAALHPYKKRVGIPIEMLRKIM